MGMNQTILNKIASIERCVRRIEEEYVGHEIEIDVNFTKQDAVILNLQRACQTAIDLGTYLVTAKKLGVPQTTREVFELLSKAKIIDTELAKNLQSMVGFRNLSVHQYSEVDMRIIHAILENHLDDFRKFIKVLRQYL